MDELQYQKADPPPLLRDYVDCCWMLHNRSAKDMAVVILPDGRIDLFLSQSATEPFHITLLGIDTQPGHTVIAPHTLMFAISFKLPAVEYLLPDMANGWLNTGQRMPVNFWEFTAADLEDFDRFCNKATQIMVRLLPVDADKRKMALFNMVYAANGAVNIKEVSQQVYWSSRQINRYFNNRFGLSLKAWCSILRFRASFPQLKAGKLFPEQDFADQSHFIKEVKKLSGVSPKVLRQNKNDLFIQFSTLPGK